MVLLGEMGKLGKELIWSLNLGILNFKYSIFQLKMASRQRMALNRKTDRYLFGNQGMDMTLMILVQRLSYF